MPGNCLSEDVSAREALRHRSMSRRGVAPSCRCTSAACPRRSNRRPASRQAAAVDASRYAWPACRQAVPLGSWGTIGFLPSAPPALLPLHHLARIFCRPDRPPRGLSVLAQRSVGRRGLVQHAAARTAASPSASSPWAVASAASASIALPPAPGLDAPAVPSQPSSPPSSAVPGWRLRSVLMMPTPPSSTDASADVARRASPQPPVV